MDQNSFGEKSENIDWTTDDELDIKTPPHGEATSGNAEASSSVDPSRIKLIQHFLGMGFSEKLVIQAVEENGENTELILECLLTYSALENSPKQQSPMNSDHSSSEYDERFMDNFSDSDSWSEYEEKPKLLSDNDRILSSLANMGYTVEEASIALARCGPQASIAELTDFICAAQLARAEDPYLPDENKPKLYNQNGKHKGRKLYDLELSKRKKRRGIVEENAETICLPNPMIGFGVPTESCPEIRRSLPEQAIGPPFFYYENVALAPKGAWDTISRNLYEIEPEFVDSKYFCAAARKRGYIHNLPIENRYPLLPLPPCTIHEALPLTKKWWPCWDTRTKLNCLQTAYASSRLTDRIRKALEDSNGEPCLRIQKYIIHECRKWNLVWVGRNKVAPLEPDEVEMLLGFPKNHTRGGGSSRTERYKSLGNSFQVDTVAYHLSVLKELFPRGIKLLSLFSGIGGAEVALYRLGIPLKTVVSVEKSEVNRNIVRSWWEQTTQTGTLIHLDDIQKLNGDQLEKIIHSIGGFDLVVGGSPCNNLAGSNRVSRDGLEGKESSLFFDYVRVLRLVKDIQGRQL